MLKTKKIKTFTYNKWFWKYGYRVNSNKKKIIAQEVGEATFDSDTKICDEISNAFNSELEKKKTNQKTK